ncbi:hypothetical protein HYW35_02540 [Candidatus Saccharibacteria bacterium]|nr:hypothetical protein [Candidatus Saccharibacteria bacterium]
MIEAGPQNGHRSDGNGHFPDDGRRVSSVGTPETDGRPDFSDVVRDHRDTLVRYVRRRKLELSPGSPDEEDVVQEAGVSRFPRQNFCAKLASSHSPQ